MYVVIKNKVFAGITRESCQYKETLWNPSAFLLI